MIKPECTQCAVGVASGTRRGQPCKFTDRAFAKGTVIYREGDRAEQAWYVKSGSIMLRQRPGPDAADEIKAVRFDGTFIGLEILVGDTYRETAVAATDAVLCGVSASGLDHWLGPPTDPARTALELTLRSQATELRQTRTRQGGALRRTAAWLRDEAPRLNDFCVQRRELADLLNMRPETLSRVFARLRDMGAVNVGRTYIDIVDIELLGAIADGRADTESPAETSAEHAAQG